MEQEWQQEHGSVTGLHLFHWTLARTYRFTGFKPAKLIYIKILIFHFFKNFPVCKTEWLGDAVSYPFPTRILNMEGYFLDIT